MSILKICRRCHQLPDQAETMPKPVIIDFYAMENKKR